VLLGRDFAVTGLRSLAYSRGVAVPASQLGKIKMIAQVIAILALILAHGRMREFYLDRIGQAALWIAVIVSLASAADYFRRFNRILHPGVAPFPTARDRGATSLKPQADSRTPSATNRKQA